MDAQHKQFEFQRRYNQFFRDIIHRLDVIFSTDSKPVNVWELAYYCM